MLTAKRGSCIAVSKIYPINHLKYNKHWWFDKCKYITIDPKYLVDMVQNAEMNEDTWGNGVYEIKKDLSKAQECYRASIY